MRTPWADTPFFEPPKRRPYARPTHVCKVGAAHYPIREAYSTEEVVPYLRLRGRWLDQLGFDVGALLKIDTAPGSITLTVIERPVPVPAKIPRKLQRAGR
ncbi:SymE family type I addiction module toxin [Stenotrophomonas sp. GZD-301]|uniref:SymE family type I addiction module toxin n=1 Tax=Stenotrophomonas sp. GZD-301 TaxID=3404814 RepID=UPI003BB802AE